LLVIELTFAIRTWPWYQSEKNYIIRNQFSAPWFGARHLFALMGFLGFVNVYAMRVNLSVAIVVMVVSFTFYGCQCHHSPQFLLQACA
jgi:hypothetical protein